MYIRLATFWSSFTPSNNTRIIDLQFLFRTDFVEKWIYFLRLTFSFFVNNFSTVYGINWPYTLRRIFFPHSACSFGFVRRKMRSVYTALPERTVSSPYRLYNYMYMYMYTHKGEIDPQRNSVKNLNEAHGRSKMRAERRRDEYKVRMFECLVADSPTRVQKPLITISLKDLILYNDLLFANRRVVCSLKGFLSLKIH